MLQVSSSLLCGVLMFSVCCYVSSFVWLCAFAVLLFLFVLFLFGVVCVCCCVRACCLCVLYNDVLFCVLCVCVCLYAVCYVCCVLLFRVLLNALL